jgi:hypothetical protein
MHISVPSPKFSAPFSHTTVIQNIIIIYTTQLKTNLGHALSCVKKMNLSMNLTAGGSGDDIVNVSSIITPTLRSKIV